MTATIATEHHTGNALAPSRSRVGTRPSRTAERRRQLVAWLRQARGHGVWILLWSIVSWVGTALSPTLLERPVLLMALAPRATFVLLAAPHMGLWSFVALGTLRLSLTDWNWYLVGRRFPERGAAKADRARTDQSRFPWVRWTLRITDQLCRWLAGRRLVAGAVLFFRPNGKYLGVAGAYGVGPALAAATSLSGTVLYLIAMHQGLGALLG
jgi:hypothetical protein